MTKTIRRVTVSNSTAGALNGFRPRGTHPFGFGGLAWRDVDEKDPWLNCVLVPTADPGRQGGKRLDLLAGINFLGASGVFAGNRVGIEVGTPLHEDLDDPQMSADGPLSASGQLVF